MSLVGFTAAVCRGFVIGAESKCKAVFFNKVKRCAISSDDKSVDDDPMYMTIAS